ncbi:MAG: cysteine hydrolase family protein [Thermomicrobiales bacterium]
MGGNAGTAFVVIDLQNEIVDGEERAYRRDELLETVAGLLADARQANVPVIFVQHNAPKYEPLTPGNPGWQIHPAVAPLPGERIVQKLAADSFAGTPLRSELDALGITNVVLAGMQTEVCIDTTARRAISLGYDVTLIADGHSTYDNEFLTAEQIIAHHNAVLANLPHPQNDIVVKTAADVRFGAAVEAAAS